MTDPIQPPSHQFEFGQTFEMEACGYAFRPIIGFELEVDGSVYMYSDGGNIEVYMLGGELEDDVSIAELNDELAADIMENVGDYDLFPSGTDSLQDVTGFLNEIRFSNPEEEGLGRALICSPHINQYFFILVIANADYWREQGLTLYQAIKSTIQFQPKFMLDIIHRDIEKHPDLTIETHESIAPEEDFIVTIEPGDVSLLLAARSQSMDEQIIITQIIAPSEKQLYYYNPMMEDFTSTIYDQPLISDHGEVGFFFPRTNQQILSPGPYRFSFTTNSSTPLQEIQFIIRSGRALDLQKIDFNFWLAMGDAHPLDGESLENFETEIFQALKQRLTPLSLTPGKIECFHPAPDELESFESIHLETDLADCSYMIAETITNERALNIGLVNQIIEGTQPAGMEIGSACSGSPGMILSSASPHACILVNWSQYQANFYDMVDAILQELVIFSGIDTSDIPHQPEGGTFTLNKEVAWRLRRHPLFYDAD